MRDPILITGCARSRTSMTAGSIALCGAFGGETTPPLSHNPKGQFENDTVRNLVKGYLRNNNLDPLGQKPLPNTGNLVPWDNLRDDILGVFYRQGYDRKSPYYYKGAKMCLLWPLFHKAFPNAKWVFVKRKTNGIINSCFRTHFMRKRNSYDEWYQWVMHHLACLAEMKHAGLDVTEISSDDLVDGKTDKLKSFVVENGLIWDEAVVNDFIDPALTKGV